MQKKYGLLSKKKEIGHSCTLDSKTTILDENAKDLFDIHLYCLEDLNCDTHAFQFLKDIRSNMQI